LHTKFPNKVIKPSRGLFQPASESGESSSSPGGQQAPPIGIKESDFYPSFAEWLKDELDEVTEAAPLGGTIGNSKWGTPDVVGIYKPVASDLIKFPIEIVVAEIKTDPKAPVVAFGQAISYRPFSTKTYIVLPTTTTPVDQAQLKSLCMLFGMGLVLFDLNKDAPAYAIQVRAQRFSPDMFYVNQFAEHLKSSKLDVFNKLFT
jgi:hypothetical protein